MEKKERKFLVDDSFFFDKGYKKIEATLVLRDSSKGILQFANGGPISLPKEFEDFIPFGNPPSFFAGMGLKDNKVYFSTYIARNIALNLILETSIDEKFVHPLLFLKTLKKSVEKFLANVNQKNETKELSFKLPTDLDEEKIQHYKAIEGIDSVIYSLMTRKHVFIVGSEEEVLEFLISIIKSIPIVIKKQIAFKINMPPNNNEIFVHAATPKNIDMFDEFLDNVSITKDIVDLKHKKIYSNYEVKSLKTIISKTNFDVSHVSQFLQDVSNMALKINENTNIEDVAENFSIDYDLAEFVIDVKKAFFSKK